MSDVTEVRIPVALTIAGSDSSGGAGIQADLKTFTTLGVYGASVITALTAQNTTGVQAVHPIPAEFVAEQIASVLGDLNVQAVKTGMLATREIIACVAEMLADNQSITSIVDPVMVATSGDPLIANDAIDAVRDLLVQRADLITPNLNEAAVLLNCEPAKSHAEMERQGNALLKLGCRAVLLKGGHLGLEGEARDLFVDATASRWYSSEYIATKNTHGTGCTLSAAIAAYIVRGEPLTEAIERAKSYLTKALRSGASQTVGAGAGPVNHLHAIL